MQVGTDAAAAARIDGVAGAALVEDALAGRGIARVLRHGRSAASIKTAEETTLRDVGTPRLNDPRVAVPG
jgi:hypothetical protein